MMEALAGSLASAAAGAAAVGLGWVLRRTRLLTAADGETAAKFVGWVTLPSLILHSFNGLTLAHIQLPVVLAALAVAALTAALSWLCYRQRHPKERGLLAGAAAGGAALPLAAYPLAAAFFGVPGLRVALLCGAANSLAMWLGGFGLFASAGAAFPEQYSHIDGGTYRGEWLGMLKQGYGAYTYPSGARYEGEWRNNLKEGRGIYRYPKGGVYEGEWRGGLQEGVGVRTFASGKVQAGVWREGKLVGELEEWQCALAVEGANEAAAVARRVQVGGGGLAEAAQQLLADPPTWAYAVAAALALTGQQLTPTLDLVSSQLATAHGPLALLALGLTLELAPPQQRQAGDVSGVLALRLLPPLLLGAAGCAALARLGWPAVQTLGVVAPMLLCAVAPVAPQVLTYAYRFRLEENLAVAITRASTAAALLLMPLLALAATASAAAGSVRPFLVALAGLSTAVAGVAAAASLQKGPTSQLPRGKVRMQYAPSAPAAAALPAAAASMPAAVGEAATTAAAASASVDQQAPATAASISQQDGSGASPPAAADIGADSGAAEAPPPPQRRRSAFSDVGPESPPPAQPQALYVQRRSGSSSSSRLRWRQPSRRPGLALRPPPRALALPTGCPAAALSLF